MLTLFGLWPLMLQSLLCALVYCIVSFLFNEIRIGFKYQYSFDPVREI